MNSFFFEANRRRVIDGLSGSVAVFTAYTALQRVNDAAHQFDQESNFWWLTGVEEPDWTLVIDGSTATSWLIAPTVEAAHHIFDGSLSAGQARDISGITKIVSAEEGDSLLRNLATKHSLVKTVGEHPHAEYFNFYENPAQKKLRLRLQRIFNSVQDIRNDLARARAIKQPVEIAAIKKAVNLTTKGFEVIKEILPKLSYEYEIEAEFDYLFKKNDSSHAYDPIVAAGINACTLHYSQNHDRLRPKDLILMDIGARVGGYAADITRTYAKTEPTKRQQQVHQAVEAAHQQIISLLGPDVSVSEYSKQADEIMLVVIQELGLYKNSDSLRRYFPHAISHGLGVDVHDSLGAPAVFKENMVLTVEPGIYIPEEKIGLRIEDDILINQKNSTNLSRSLSTGW